MSSRSLDTHISLSSLESLLLYFFFVFYYIFLSVIYTLSLHSFFFFFFNDPPTPEISPLSLHDALPIFHPQARRHPGNPGLPAEPAADSDRRAPYQEPVPVHAPEPGPGRAGRQRNPARHRASQAAGP